MKRGLLVTVDGLDGTGKSSLIKAFAKSAGLTCLSSINSNENAHILTLTKMGKSAKDIHLYALSCLKRSCTEAEMLMGQGKDVIFDRSVFSSLAYYYAIAKDNKEKIAFPNYSTYGFIEPDIAIILDLAENIREERISKRTSPADWIDKKTFSSASFRDDIRDCFINLKIKNQNLVIVDTGKTPEEILEEVVNLFEKKQFRRRIPASKMGNLEFS